MNREQLNKQKKEDLIELYIQQVLKRDQDVKKHMSELKDADERIEEARTLLRKSKGFNEVLCDVIGDLPNYL